MPLTVITGANRGLGLAHTRRYLERGWTVHAACRDPEGADALNALGGDLFIHRYDAADPAAPVDLADAVAQPVDVLFANAGVMGAERGKQAFGQVSPDDWMNALKVNALAPLLLAQAFAGLVAQSEQKKIVLQSSRMGSVADNDSGSFFAALSLMAASPQPEIPCARSGRALRRQYPVCRHGSPSRPSPDSTPGPIPACCGCAPA